MIKGFVEAIRSFQVRGWVYDTDAPTEAVTVKLLVAGDEIAIGLANNFREDLLNSGKGDGRHGFVLNVDQKLPTDTPDLIEVVAQSASGFSELVPRIIDAVIDRPPAQTVPPEHQPSPIMGYFRVLPPFEIKGWAYDPRQRDEHLTVEISAGGRALGSVVADQFRTDLVSALVGNGDHGFCLTTAEELPADIAETVEVIARSPAGASGLLQLLPSNPAHAEPAERGQPAVPFLGHSQDRAHHPVFILGAARSGTSAMAQALTAATRYRGHEEGHLLDLIAPMLQLIARHYEEQGGEWVDRQTTMIAAVSKRFFEDGVRHIFVELARSLFPEGWWLDKTPRPAMITAAPLLQQIWPAARFIFLKRRAVENIVSRMAKFPATPFENHCRDWALAMQTWMAVRQTLAGAAIEIDQLYLATRPSEVATALSSLLLLQPGEVLDLAQALAADRPERTAENFGSVHSLAALSWTPDQKETFERLCGPTMAAYGYGRGEEYYGPDAQESALVRL